MGLADQMYNPDVLADIKNKLKSLASDIEPLAEANKVYLIMYSDARFDSVDGNECYEVIRGKFDSIRFKESDDSRKQVFQIVLKDLEERRRMVVTGGANAFVVLDFINRLCNMMVPNEAKVELYFERNGKYVNGRIREVETGSEIQPLMYYNNIPKDKDERLQLYLKHVSDLMKRKEAFSKK